MAVLPAELASSPSQMSFPGHKLGNSFCSCLNRFYVFHMLEAAVSLFATSTMDVPQTMCEIALALCHAENPLNCKQAQDDTPKGWTAPAVAKVFSFLLHTSQLF